MTQAAALDTHAHKQPPEGRMWRRPLIHYLVSYRRNWRGSAISSFLVPLMFLGVMGYLLGPLVDRGTGGGIAGMEYVAFVAPGLLAAQAMQAAVGESTFPVLAGIKWRRFYHAMLATPLGVRDVILGHLVFVTFRIALTSTVFLIVAFALGAIRSPWAVLALPVAVLCGLAFATPVFAYSARQTDGQGFAVLFRFAVMPLFLFSGTFFPMTQLPGWLQPVAWATPLAHGIDLSRDLSLGTPSVTEAVVHVGFMLLWLIAGLALAEWSLRRRMVR